MDTPFRALAIIALGLTLLPSASAPDPLPHPAVAAGSVPPASFTSSATRPAYGLLWLQIDPDDVSITLDGHYLDKDVWLISVPPGDHEIRVSKAGYRPSTAASAFLRAERPPGPDPVAGLRPDQAPE